VSLMEEHAIEYVPLQETHIPTLLDIELEAYPDPWTEGMFQQELHSHASYFFLAFRGDMLVGYGGFWLVVDEAHITKVTVAKACRRMKYGRSIMRYLLQKARELGAKTVRLEVRESNAAARSLYESMGFEEVGLRRGYYAQTNETAVVMTRTLADA